VTHIRAEDLPEPFATPSVGNAPITLPKLAPDLLALPSGFEVKLWADGFQIPRQAYVTPNGDVLVVETGARKVTLLRDTDDDGVADFRTDLINDLNQPFGIDMHDGRLYVGNTDSVIRAPYTIGEDTLGGELETVVDDIPPGGHWTRDVVFSPSGDKMYVSIGSGSNINEEELPRATIMEYNPDGSAPRLYASGLRNPVGLRFSPATDKLWTAVNERDGLGDDVPPDYVTSVADGAFYGWPYSYIGANPEPRHDGKRMDLVETAIVPDVLIQAHSAALGLLFYTGDMFPAEYQGELLVALHGSWNRAERTGYKIIRVHMDADGHPLGSYEDFLTGWSTDPKSKMVWGRPVGLAQMPDGSVLVLDDGGNRIWRVTFTPPVGVDDRPTLPTQWSHIKTFATLPAFPNPSNPDVWIPYVLANESAVAVSLYDGSGARIRHIDVGIRSVGEHTARESAAHWDGRDDEGELVASGVYFAQLTANDVRGRMQRIVLMR
jgi:glucose/arabinose dehydrogenase